MIVKMTMMTTTMMMMLERVRFIISIVTLHISVLFSINGKKQFKKVCKDDRHYLAELKQQKSKRLILLLQHIAITSMCS